MELQDLFKGRENEVITPIHLSEICNALGDTTWWIKVKGKCYSPRELMKKYPYFQGCKLGDLKQVDPTDELARADKILADLKRRRDEFAERIASYVQGFWY